MIPLCILIISVIFIHQYVSFPVWFVSFQMNLHCGAQNAVLPVTNIFDLLHLGIYYIWGLGIVKFGLHICFHISQLKCAILHKCFWFKMNLLRFDSDNEVRELQNQKCNTFGGKNTDLRHDPIPLLQLVSNAWMLLWIYVYVIMLYVPHA